MTRAEAIELAAKAYVEFVAGYEPETPWVMPTTAEKCAAILDALLEAGMTFGEETRVRGWRASFDAEGVTLHREQPDCEGDEATDPFPSVFVHRPQGESK